MRVLTREKGVESCKQGEVARGFRKSVGGDDESFEVVEMGRKSWCVVRLTSRQESMPRNDRRL
jgi:hypothetical protein